MAPPAKTPFQLDVPAPKCPVLSSLQGILPQLVLKDIPWLPKNGMRFCCIVRMPEQ